MKLEAHEVVLVVGVRGTGKTHWAQREIVTDARRVVVWDPYGEYPCRESCTLDELCADSARLDREALSLAVVPSWRTPTDLCAEFETFADVAPTIPGGTVLVIDECRLLRGASELLIFMATQSRHWGDGVPLVLIAQRAVGVPPDARDQVSRVVSFRQSSPKDIAALVEQCGDAAQRVKSLPRFEFFAWDESQAFEETNTAGQAG